MRIAFFSECYTPVINGVVTSISTLREELLERGHQVYVVAPGAPSPDDDSDIHRLPALPFPRHPYRFARPFPHLDTEFENLDIELIHCHHPFTVGRLGAEMARRLDLPMVYTAHSLYDNMVKYSRSPLMRSVGQRAVRGVVRRFCARSDCVIVPSMHTRNALMEDRIRAPFAVIPSGMHLRPVSRGGRARIRAKLGITEEMQALIYIGRIAPEKRVDLLLRALRVILDRDTSLDTSLLRLILVGDGQCRNDMEALSVELGIQNHVQFAGAQPFAEIGDWYAAGDLFVMPSPAETQGIVLLEAMGAGLACVAVAEGGPVEVVRQGETGLLAPFDPEAYADAALTLLLEPALRRRMGENGRRVAANFTPESMAKGVLDVYDRVIEMRRDRVVKRVKP